jgi:hypothetical protein
MKHPIFTLLFIPCFIAIQSCSSGKPGESTGESSTSSAAPAEGATKSEPAKKTAAGGCCFTRTEDFTPFFPTGNKLLTIHGAEELSANFYCGADDDPRKSQASRKYQIEKEGTTDKMISKFITLKIHDYCSRQDELAAEIERRTTNSERDATGNGKVRFERIEKAGLYKGYTWVDSSPGNNASNVLLYVAVDGRFMIQIQGIDHSRIDAMNQLFEMIPLEKLAAF